MKKLILLIAVLILGLTGCSSAPKTDKLTVAVSIPPQKAFAEKICGDKAEIILTIPAGASAETHEMSFKEIARLNDAQIYFSIGVPAEEKGILPHLSDKTKEVALHEKVSAVYPDINIGTSRDPHIWLSPKRAIVMVEEMAKEIADSDPKNADFYNKNADSLIEELKSTKNEITNMFRDKKLKIFYIAHPSYGYFAEDFGLKMVALEENGHEATPKDLAELVSQMKAQGVKTVFCQEEASKKQAELVAKEIGGEIEILSPLSEDYINSLKATANLIYKAVN